MKKLFDYIPLIIAGMVILLLVVLFIAGAFDAPQETTITSSMLVEMIGAEKLSTARSVQHGIAKAYLESQGKDVYIMYYATVEPYVQLSDVVFAVDNEARVVTVVLPENFEIDVDLIEDEQHQFYYYPDQTSVMGAGDVGVICKADAEQKAKENQYLLQMARTSLTATITALLKPIVDANN